MVFKTLNAGCGCDSWGDVRIDIQSFSDLFYKKKTSANLIASVEYLPFIDGIFEESRCYHVLEHVPDPYKCLDELKRVTSKKIIIRFPYHHFFNYMFEFIALFKYMILSYINGPSNFIMILKRLKNLKGLYSTHKWYIKGKKINRAYFFIPLEYETIINMELLS